MAEAVLKAWTIGAPMVAVVIAATHFFDLSQGLSVLLFAITVGVFATYAAMLDDKARRGDSRHDNGAPTGV